MEGEKKLKNDKKKLEKLIEKFDRDQVKELLAFIHILKKEAP